ncbi:hypothetical protein [Coleofasciculus sp.]|uniref:hypothetical protein n=1 Tax=Coleofasciculus sp. TaxID=3100458 RepID=UPI003A2D8EDA
MLSDFDEIFPSEDTPEPSSDDFDKQFIEDYIQTQKARIETRKLIQEILFFAACQVASASLAILLFQYAVQVVFTAWLCLFIAWIPSLANLGEVNLQKTEEGWTLRIMNKPIITLIKFISSVGIVTVTIYSIADELDETAKQITAVYNEIQQYEQPQIDQFLPPYFWQVILAAVAIVLLANCIKTARDLL